MHVYRRGDRGPVVAEIRTRLAVLGLLGGDALTGPAATDPAAADYDEVCEWAVRGFQQSRGLRVDGMVGPETYRALDEARWRLGDRLLSYTVSHPLVGDDVADLQERLSRMGFDPGRHDGIYGRATESALRDFQRNVGLVPDGNCGPRTLRALSQLTRTVAGGDPQQLREHERLMAAGPTLAGKVIVLDPGHGDGDPGVQAHGQCEAQLVEDLAARIEGRLGAVGAVAYLTRGADSSPSDEERAGFANEAGADLLLSLHVDAAHNPSACGAATFHYTTSRVGARFAELVQKEVVARTDLLDCRTHGKTWELLRRTRMPAVRLDIGYLTSAGDAARLGSPEFRDTVAEAVIAAVHRLYLPPELDVDTGQLRMPAYAG